MENTIKQDSLGTLVANQLRQRIWDKDIHFGDRLIENDLSKEYGVSRNTIRDALKILEYEELVVIKPRRGTYVSNFSIEDWKDMIELRTIMEAYAFVKALPFLNKEHIKTLNDILRQMKIAANNENWSTLFDLDLKFHSYVIHLSNNKRFIKLYGSLQVQIRTFLVYLDDYYSSHQSFYDEQKELFDVLLTKDPVLVDQKIRTHITYVEGILLAEQEITGTKL